MFCDDCHNPDTWDLSGGRLVEIKAVISELSMLKGQKGITFSGGEPMLQPGACREIAEWAKRETPWDIWCFSGFAYEEIKAAGGERWEFLKFVDVLVDGRFDAHKRDISLRFRGSGNQRLIRLCDGEFISIL
jgi:anaerobic ribonucleoside-triphosphate reductase activating protein